jgi:hypothetical protein
MALPLAMILLSAYSVLSAFSGALVAIVAWLAAVTIAVYLNRFVHYPRGVVFELATRSVSMPGSWVPLALMMTIYFTKYGVNVALARNPGFPTVQWFVISTSFAYGFLSGVFLAGAFSLWCVATRGAARAA